MAKYVELTGVPGVGKTTTYNSLKSLQAKDENFIVFDDLHKVIASDKLSLKTSIKLFIKKCLKMPTSDSLLNDRKLVEKFTEENHELIQLFWNGIHTDRSHMEGKDLRFHVVKSLSNTIQKIQIVKDVSTNKCCLLDEGLIHSIGYFMNHTSALSFKEQVSNVLNVMRLPDGVVFFNGDIDTVIDRTLKRGNVIQRDAHLSAEELIQSRIESIKNRQIVIEEVSAMGIPVLDLDAKEVVSDKARKIQSFISKLS